MRASEHKSLHHVAGPRCVASFLSRLPRFSPVITFLNTPASVHAVGRPKDQVLRIVGIQPHRTTVAMVKTLPGLAAVA
jgi:hypothetical protein